MAPPAPGVDVAQASAERPSKSRLHPLAFHSLARRTSPTWLGNQTCLRTRARNARSLRPDFGLAPIGPLRVGLPDISGRRRFSDVVFRIAKDRHAAGQAPRRCSSVSASSPELLNPPNPTNLWIRPTRSSRASPARDRACRPASRRRRRRTPSMLLERAVARNSAQACGSASTCRRRYSSRAFARHACAQPMKKRWSPVRPSITGAALPLERDLPRLVGDRRGRRGRRCSRRA